MAEHNRQELELSLQKLQKKTISLQEASLITGYTTVHLRNLVKKYSIYGSRCLINGHRGQIPANKIKDAEKRKIVSHYKKDFSGFNFKLFYDDVFKSNDKYSYTTIYNILTAAGIQSPEKRKVPHAEVHRPRLRKLHEGEMLQIDATPFPWFEWCGNKTVYALHGSIDDATGKITALTMCDNECLYGYLDLIRQTYFTHGFGHPYSIYSDRAAIFCYTPRYKKGLAEMELPELADALKEEKTQWQRCMKELGVKQILAYSPQAKGRIERLWRTLQGRLPYYFKKNKIKTVDQANEYFLKFIPEYNKEFAIKPASAVKVWHTTGKNPEYILSARFERKTNDAGVFSFHNCKFKLNMKHPEKQKIEVCVNNQGIKAYYKGNFFPVELIEKKDGISTQTLDSIIYKYMLSDCKKVSI